jgi:hypothetical protein
VSKNVHPYLAAGQRLWQHLLAMPMLRALLYLGFGCCVEFCASLLQTDS